MKSRVDLQFEESVLPCSAERENFVLMKFYFHGHEIKKWSASNFSAVCMGGKTKRAMLSERSEVGSRDVSVSYGAMS